MAGERRLVPIPSPLFLMKKSKRILDFETDGKPIHPLMGQGLPVTFSASSQKLADLAAHFEASTMIVNDARQVLLVKGGEKSKNWHFPTETIKKNEGALSCAKRILKAHGFKEHETKEIYSNMDNFDRRAHRHGWVESTIFLTKVAEVGGGADLRGAKWFNKNEVPKQTFGLHKLFIEQFL